MAVFSHQRDLNREKEFEGFFDFQPAPQAVSNTMSLSVQVLEPWTYEDGRSQPFHNYNPEDLKVLAESIRENGMMNPPIVWMNPRCPGKYQIISGHNRIEAAKLLGMDRVKCVVATVSYAEAKKMLIQSNLRQRQKILPSEYAAAYTEELKDVEDLRGKGSTGNEGRTEAVKKLAEQENVSVVNLYRYLKLNDLAPDLLAFVDAGKIPVVTGVGFAAFPSEYQSALLSVLTDNNIDSVTAVQGKQITDAWNEDMSQEEFQKAALVALGKARKPAKAKAPKPSGFAVYVAPDLSSCKKSVGAKLKKDAAYQQGLAEVVQKAAQEAVQKYTEEYLAKLEEKKK